MGMSDIMRLDVSWAWLVLTAVLLAAAVFYLYTLILSHLAKTTVRNKVVLITDSLSTVGNGFLPSLISRRSGHILLVNSIQGKLAMPFRTTYAASKHAVQAFFECLRAEVQEYGITVSTINHTFIKTSSSIPKDEITARSMKTDHAVPGVSPKDVATELLRTLSSKKKEILMARWVPKAALYVRSLFPNLFFAIMAARVSNTVVEEMPDD